MYLNKWACFRIHCDKWTNNRNVNDRSCINAPTLYNGDVTNTKEIRTKIHGKYTDVTASPTLGNFVPKFI